jgi:hypothetical protein
MVGIGKVVLSCELSVMVYLTIIFASSERQGRSHRRPSAVRSGCPDSADATVTPVTEDERRGHATTLIGRQDYGLMQAALAEHPVSEEITLD